MSENGAKEKSEMQNQPGILNYQCKNIIDELMGICLFVQYFSKFCLIRK